MHCTESELVTFGYALLLLNEEYVSIRNDCRPGSAFYRVIHLRKLTSDFGTENPGGAIIIESPYSSSTILDVAANDTIRRERCAYLALPSLEGIKHGWHVGVGLDPPLTASCCLDTIDLPCGVCAMVLFRSAVWNFSAEEKQVNSFIDSVSGHWETLNGLLGVAKDYVTFLTKGLSMALKPHSIGVWKQQEPIDCSSFFMLKNLSARFSSPKSLTWKKPWVVDWSYIFLIWIWKILFFGGGNAPSWPCAYFFADVWFGSTTHQKHLPLCVRPFIAPRSPFSGARGLSPFRRCGTVIGDTLFGSLDGNPGGLGDGMKFTIYIYTPTY